MRNLAKALYVQVYENRFVLKRLDSGGPAIEIESIEPFSTQRLLVGQFQAASRALERGFKQARAVGSLFGLKPAVVIQPMEKIDGGLSEVEERILTELVLGAGARKVKVWVGRELSDAEARKLL